MESNRIFISLAGNIGSGKTTLTKMLSKKLGWKAHYESVSNNPYLKDFYQDMGRWSFPLQIYFLKHRFEAHQEITRGTTSAIQDRSVYEDAHIFAKNLRVQGYMSQRDYENYFDLFHLMLKFLQPPHLIVYLKRSINKLKERIKVRARDFEGNIPDSYLASLNDYYDHWIEKYDLGKKIIVHTDTLDFIHEPKDFQRLNEMILSSLEKRDHNPRISPLDPTAPLKHQSLF